MDIKTKHYYRPPKNLLFQPVVCNAIQFSTGFPVYKMDNTNFFSLSYVGGVTQAYVTYIKLPDKF